ncbi:MAG: dihydroneopterin triphosphate diphosphatase [Polaromonas sp.]|nr:dihydroneopterin triphosphate diphosphatase [Polaromonas sp.]
MRLSVASDASHPFKIPESVLVVIHTAQLDVLLIERAENPGFWQSVTGSKDALNEALLDTALREVMEETGITASADEFVDWSVSNIYEIYPAWRGRYAPGVTHNTEHVFSLCVPAGISVKLSPREHTAYRWLPHLDAADMCFSPSNAEALLLLPQFMA